MVSSCGLIDGDPEPVKVPDVRGIRYASARAELRDLGFDVRRKVVAGAEPRNTVLRQSFRPGKSVEEGSIIRLRISDGTLAAEGEEPDSAGAFDEVYAEVSDGVMRVETTACDFGGHGSGFLVAPDLVVTVGHVVAGGVSVVVSGAGDVSTGQVIGIDNEGTDLALVQTDTEFSGHVFEFVDDPPLAGSQVAVIGYPIDEPLSITTGDISGLDRVITVEDWGRVVGAIQTGTAINPGNSGGPMVDRDGRVVGLAEAKNPEAEGIAFAVSATEAEPRVQEWMQNPQLPEIPECAAPVGPGSETIRSDVAHSHLSGLLDTFQAYFDGINYGEFRLAYKQFSPDRREELSFGEFRSALLTSYDFDVSIRFIEEVDATHDDVLVTFWSVQEAEYGPDNQECTKWTLDYSMVNSGDRWFIEGAQEHGEDGSVAC